MISLEEVSDWIKEIDGLRDEPKAAKMMEDALFERVIKHHAQKGCSISVMALKSKKNKMMRN